MAILSVVALALLQVVGAHVAAAALAAERERALWDEERLLTAHTLLSTADLDRRLGMRDVGLYLVTVQRPERALYRIAVSRAGMPGVEDLVTVVHRRGGASER